MRASITGRDVDLGPFQQRVLLAALLVRANHALSVERLMDAVWGESTPRTARKNIHVYVSSLRKLLPNGIRRHPYGYSVELRTEELDLLSFRHFAFQGRDAVRRGQPDVARKRYRAALALWRDEPMIDLTSNTFIATEAETIIESCLDVFEEFADLELECGTVGPALIEKLREMVQRYPLRERLVTSLMSALASLRAGRRRQRHLHASDAAGRR